jgi:hypothetical protein
MDWTVPLTKIEGRPKSLPRAVHRQITGNHHRITVTDLAYAAIILLAVSVPIALPLLVGVDCTADAYSIRLGTVMRLGGC